MNGADSLIRFTTAPWQTYSIQHKQSLNDGSWAVLDKDIAGDGGTNTITHQEGATAPTQFYRVATELLPLAKP